MPDNADNVPPTGAIDDRWQDLMRSMDPVANLNALADVWRQAAASSEQVVSSFVSGNGWPADHGGAAGDGPARSSQGANAAGDATGSATSNFGPSSRDLRIDFERSVDQMADAAKRFFAQMPWAQSATESSAEAPRATVAVIDGIGTTEVQLPVGEGADGQPWATSLVRHDGATIADSGILLRSSPHFGSTSADPASTAATSSFIVKVQTPPGVAPGAYYGQILCPGLDDFVLPLEVRVYDES